MDLTKSLVYNLQGSSLIEHPVIVTAHQSHAFALFCQLVAENFKNKNGRKMNL